MIKKNLQKIAMIIKKINFFYVIYRVLNVFIVNIIWGLNLSSIDVNSHRVNIMSYVNFEYPAPNLNDVIDYDTLGWCHKCLINKNEFINYSDYRSIEYKIDISFVLFPWTIPIDFFSPDNDQYRHQFNDHYDIAVWCGYNVFSGKYEQIFFYYGDWIILFPICGICFVFSLICYLYKKLIKRANKRCP